MLRCNALFTPADVTALHGRDLSDTACVVFDVFRATTSMLTALAHGATAVVPVADIPTALEWRRREPDVLLAGERDGHRITAKLSGSVDFDLGNSPREFTRARVAGRRIVTTTTNGTKALRGCAHAAVVLPGALVNIAATAAALRALQFPKLLLIGAGTEDEAAYEDILGIGALIEALQPELSSAKCADSVPLAHSAYLAARPDFMGAIKHHSRNGQRLLRLPDLAADVAVCLELNTQSLAARLHPDGVIRAI